MSDVEEIQSVDDLQYEWPPDILRYEQRFLFGMTVTDLLVIAGAMILPMLVHVLLGLLGGLCGVLAVRRFEGLGDRRLPEYLLARLGHRFARQAVVLPRLLPPGKGGYDITDLDGKVLASFSGDGEGGPL